MFVYFFRKLQSIYNLCPFLAYLEFINKENEKSEDPYVPGYFCIDWVEIHQYRNYPHGNGRNNSDNKEYP